MKIIKKEGGRIPFAYVFAIIFVLMLLLAGIYASILGRHNIISIDKFYKESDQDLRNINDMVREKAYHSLMEIIHNITKQRDPKLYMIQKYLEQNMSNYINATFPIITQDYVVKVDNYTVKVVMDYKKTKAFIKDFKLKWIDYTYGLDNLQEGYKKQTQLPVYPYVVGYFNYTFKDRRSGFVMKRLMKFNRIVYSPLPLLKFEFDEFRTSTTNAGDFGRLIKYILTTITEYRILIGDAAGQYGGYNVSVTQVLTKADVEKAVNLALLLESVRYFGTYDKNTAAKMGIGTIIDQYLKKGTIDAADIYFLWNHMNSYVWANRILGQSIYSYADRFVYELLREFWTNNDLYADPTLKEPLLNWEKIKQKGDDWIKDMLAKYLDVWRGWLQIPKIIIPHYAKVDITEKFDIVIILPKPPYIIYEPDQTVTLHWVIWNMPVENTVDLILGPKPKNFELYALGTSTDPPYVHIGHYQYQLVKQSFIEEHQHYKGGSDPYLSTLEYVMDALTRSMKKRSNTWDNTSQKGFIDFAAYDASMLSYIDNRNINLAGNPKDENTILINGTQEIVNGPLTQASNTFSKWIYPLKETWWKYGAYRENSTGDNDAYLYYLTKDTVDLWYQAMKNLYDGGDPSHTDDAGPYDSDCNHYPSHHQVSTWPTPYSGYPFYGVGNHNGSFNFHRDLTRDAYNDIRELMWEKAIEKGLEKGGVGIPIYSHENVWNDVKQKTEDARQKVVGQDGLIKNLNFWFWPYVYFNKAYFIVKQFGDLRTFMDYITDNGSYKSKSDSDLSNFYKFVRWRVGLPILGIAGLPPVNPGNSSGGGGGNNTTHVTGLGLDVSHYQGTIDWTKVRNAGYTFVFVKASQGTSYVDPLFSTNVQGASAAGLKVGAYHFAEPSDDPIAEADHFVDVIKPYLSYMSLPPALDLEQTGGLSWSALSNWANEFEKEVQAKTGITPIIYVNVNYATNLDSSVTQWPLWIADWTYNPNATPRTGKWSSWSFWQYSDSGSVPGIAGSSVDLDKASGRTLEMLYSIRAGSSYSVNGLLGELAKWIPNSYQVMEKNIILNARYSSIPIFPSVHSNRHIFWDTTHFQDANMHRTKNETVWVDFQPDYLEAGKNLNIGISLGPGHKFVDVQDTDYDMSEAPYEYQYTVTISGTLNLNLHTDRTSLVYGGIHWLTWYNGTVPINLNIKVPIYSAWFLESHWNSCTAADNWAFHTDVPFSYTRGYFNMLGKDSPTKPFFISQPLNTFIYDYEKIGEVWNRYATFTNFALINIKDELAAWNYTYHRIITNATKEVATGINAASSGFSTAQNDLNNVFAKANGYTNQLHFFYFSRDFTVTSSQVQENNGYRQFNVNLGSKTVQEKYQEGKYSVQGQLSGSGVNLQMSNYYDYMHISLSIKTGSITPYFLSYHNISGGRSVRMYVERLDNVLKTDFGLVGDSSAINNLAKYFPKNITYLTQESLIKVFHQILKDIYVNETISYRFGIFVNLIGGNQRLTYIIWYNGTPTPDSFIIWLNNEIRPIVYELGISEFPQYSYDLLTLNNIYYSVNNLWMDTDYDSSSIFGYATQGHARAAWDGYVIEMSYHL
ncbi:MAG: hypothetical protein GXO25_01435 [Euryarchaeota archaeon]|nr:hypothetical protein [Euryarchaeota archaeon]